MKTITLRDDTCQTLLMLKEGEDSFSDVINRLISKKNRDIREYAGSLRDSKIRYRYVPAGAGWEPEHLLSADNPERRVFAGCPFCRVPDRVAILLLCRLRDVLLKTDDFFVKKRR